MRAYVYFNLHKRCWSVKALSGPNRGRVVRHVNVVHMHNVGTHVNHKARERVRNTGRKEVHAGITGDVVAMAPEPLDVVARHEDSDGWSLVTYNPYRFDSFVTKTAHEPVTQSDQVVMLNGSTGPEVWMYNAA